jgi:hypothetical protein
MVLAFSVVSNRTEAGRTSFPSGEQAALCNVHKAAMHATTAAFLAKIQQGCIQEPTLSDSFFACSPFCRGRRHQLGLPLNGQKTGSNAKTARKFKRHLMYDVK